jgi:tripartite-type tricarboxylate transporter receptor subunit TctC
LFKATAGLDIVHVPYSGAAPATVALLAGQVKLMFNNMISAMPHVADGRLRALAVTGLRRSPVLPEVPTLAESLPNFDATTWYAALAPAGTPPEIVESLNRALTAAVVVPETRDRLLSQGVEPTPLTPAELGSFLVAEMAKWGQVAHAASVRTD